MNAGESIQQHTHPHVNSSPDSFHISAPTSEYYDNVSIDQLTINPNIIAIYRTF